MKLNSDYKNAALEALRGRWPNVLLCTVVVMIITYISVSPQVINNLSALGQISVDFANPLFMSGFGFALNVFILFPLSIGIVNTFNRLYLYGDYDCVSILFKETFGGYVRNAVAGFLMYIFVLLWSILFVIPGIIKMFSYAMTPYILKDYPELSPNKAIDMSRAMMKGRKFDLFYLYLSFIGWWILSIVTCGIGFFWLFPYIMTTQAAFYEDVKQDYLNKTQTTI